MKYLISQPSCLSIEQNWSVTSFSRAGEQKIWKFQGVNKLIFVMVIWCVLFMVGIESSSCCNIRPVCMVVPCFCISIWCDVKNAFGTFVCCIDYNFSNLLHSGRMLIHTWPLNWGTPPCHLSTTAYSLHLELPSI
jgi:hypothetical protein